MSPRPIYFYFSAFYFSVADGAGLVYTSAKDGVNCSLLHRYLLGCVYPGAFSSTDEGQVCKKQKHAHRRRPISLPKASLVVPTWYTNVLCFMRAFRCWSSLFFVPSFLSYYLARMM